jgi:hypothetical protein
MNLIPTRVHGMIDYLMGVLLIAAPFVFRFPDGGAETMVPVILGVGMIVYSLITDYEMGAIHVLPMSTHLAIDVVAGIFLAASPWIFGFSHRITWPHVTFGIMEIAVALLTQRRPRTVRTTDDAGATMGHPATHA